MFNEVVFFCCLVFPSHKKCIIREHIIYLCKSGFTTILLIKTKTRNCLNVQADIQIAISNKMPRFEKVLCNKQEQKSH